MSGTEPTRRQLIDARLHLMDRQILDSHDVPVTVVDDVALADRPDGQPWTGDDPPPVITDLLSGPVKGTRIFGGRPPASRLERIPWRNVRRLGVAVRLRVPREVLTVGWGERWVAAHIIGRIPGARHDPE